MGHSIPPAGAAEFAAVLACGPGSAVSHRSAARLWRLPTFQSWSTPVEVTVVGRDPGQRPGVRVYRTRAFHPRDVRRLAGIATTAPTRTLLDVAALIPIEELTVAFADARARRLVDSRSLAELAARSRGRRGANAFRRALELHDTGALTRSEAERKMLALVRAAALPVPEVNARVGRFEVDLLWRKHKVIVEVDGYAFHSGQTAFEGDRERDAVLIARGYVVLRVTWRHLVAHRDAVIARVAAALALRS